MVDRDLTSRSHAGQAVILLSHACACATCACAAEGRQRHACPGTIPNQCKLVLGSVAFQASAHAGTCALIIIKFKLSRKLAGYLSDMFQGLSMLDAFLYRRPWQVTS